MAGHHYARKHATLSASSSKRWLNCTPSAKLEAQFRDSDSDFAREGTLAHEFGDFFLRLQNGEITKGRYEEATDKLRKHELYSSDMDGYVETYTDYVLERWSFAKRINSDAPLLVESRIDFSEYVPDGFGTGDATIISDKELEVIDLKYGRGVPVYAENNPQLMLYALGSALANDLLYSFETVRFTIVQPRLHSITSEALPVEELMEWAQQYVKPRALKAFQGLGDPLPGDWCQFCKAKPKCRALANHINDLARLEFAEPKLLTDEELVETYQKMPLIKKWVDSVYKYMLSEALEGRPLPGFKAVNGQARSSWKEPEAALETLRALGFQEEQLVNVKIKAISDIKQLMSVDRFSEDVAKHTHRPVGGPVLVTESDKRQAIGPANVEARDIFTD